MSKLDQLKALGDAKRVARNDLGRDARERLQEVILPATVTDKAVSAARMVTGTGSAGVEGSNPSRSTKLKRGRPKIIGKRAWEVEGISRRTWYRRKNK